MSTSDAKRWTVLVPVLLAGMAAGLIVAGLWDGRPSGNASEAALQALEPPVASDSAAGGVPVMPVSYEEAVTGTARAAQQGLPSLSSAAARVRPAVVGIEVEGFREVASTQLQIPEEFRRYFQFPDEDQQQGEEPYRQRVRGEGSGFIFSPDGHIITNHHVVDGAEEITVTLPDKRRYDAVLVGSDELTDVAVIKIETDEELPTVALGDSDMLEIADWVLAIGNPLQFDFTVTAGIVSAKGRSLNIGPTDGNVNLGIQDYIQTDAVINRGNSGGPLVDLSGRVVGINTAIASQTGLYEGYGFAVPINLARAVARDLIEYGRVRRSWLGIQFQSQPVGADIAEARSLPYSPPIGVLVTTVTPGGPADEAGLEVDDILVKIEGEPIDTGGELQTMVSTASPGTRIEVTVYRGGNSRRAGRELTLTVTLRERPADTSAPQVTEEESDADRLGLEVTDLDRDTARELGFSGRGLLVEAVEPYGPAWDAQFRNGGFVLMEVDGEAVPNLQAYERVLEGLETGSYVMIKTWIPGQDQELTVAVKVR